MTRRKEYVAYATGVEDGLDAARLNTWAAMRRTVEIARTLDNSAAVAAADGDYELAVFAIAYARHIRWTIRSMIGTA